MKEEPENLFQRREYDFHTGLYYFRARWYNPETGRWLSKDPLGEWGGCNLYAFYKNNLVNFIDPIGLMSNPPKSAATYAEAYHNGSQANDQYQDPMDKLLEMANNPSARTNANQRTENAQNAKDQRDQTTNKELKKATEQAVKDNKDAWKRVLKCAK